MIPEEEENEQRNELAVLLVVLREKAQPGPPPDWLGLICVERKESEKINNRCGDGEKQESRERTVSDPDQKRAQQSAKLCDLLHGAPDLRAGE